MFLANDTGVQHTGLGVQGVDSGVDAQFSDGTRQHSGGIQVCKGGGRGGVGQVVCRNIDSLNRSDRTLLCGGDMLLPEPRQSAKYSARVKSYTDMPPISVERAG